jgi:UDP-glucose 4-epimerase
MKILVTGGAGYIGSLLTAVLLDKGYEVVVCDNIFFGGESHFAFWHHRAFKFAKGDVSDPSCLTPEFYEGVDAVVPPADEFIAVDANSTDGTVQFLESQGVRVVQQERRG